MARIYSELEIVSEMFDQPEWRGVMPTKIIICSSPRSGSWMLCRYMLQNGLGVPAEYFNRLHLPGLAARFGVRRVEDLDWLTPGRIRRWVTRRFGRDPRSEFMTSYVAALFARRTVNDVFAAKVQWLQYLDVLDNPAGRRLLRDARCIYLYRKDIVDQAISLHISTLTGRWGPGDEITSVPAGEPNYLDTVAIAEHVRRLAEEELGWQHWFAANRVSCLNISYEEFIRDTDHYMKEIALFCGLSSDALPLLYREESAPRAARASVPSRAEIRTFFLSELRKPLNGMGVARGIIERRNFSE